MYNVRVVYSLFLRLFGLSYENYDCLFGFAILALIILPAFMTYIMEVFLFVTGSSCAWAARKPHPYY